MFVLILICAAWAYGVPWYVADQDGFIYGSDVRLEAMKGKTCPPKIEFVPEHQLAPVDYLHRRECVLIEIRRTAVGVRIPFAPSATLDLTQLELADKELHALDALMPAPQRVVKFIGFLDSKVQYLYFIAYLFIGVHLARMQAESRDPLRFRLFRMCGLKELANIPMFGTVVAIGALVAMSWIAHNLLRTFSFNNNGRTIFSFVHADISPSSWRLQVARSVILCGLIGASCVLWSLRQWKVRRLVSRWRVRRAALKRMCWAERSTILVRGRARAVRDLFESWQVHSALLSAAFTPWMFYYWSLDDSRYYMSNLTLQIIWGGLWWLVSGPALYSAYAFKHYRSDVIGCLMARNEKKSLIDAVRKEIPVSFVRILGSAFAAVTAYLLPILHKVFT